ncbi:response regulator transcription factor [Pelagicoccus sp. NFK12]|uniref:Response regulator transcription factor n=1 Tax=Pelagicoccus enzymogenes TaxID=2773457 RepID=A0A927F8D5_9BACT|nr:response regulator transcription factor [Pelagicoccus enzymogenes]
MQKVESMRGASPQNHQRKFEGVVGILTALGWNACFRNPNSTGEFRAFLQTDGSASERLLNEIQMEEMAGRVPDWAWLLRTEEIMVWANTKREASGCRPDLTKRQSEILALLESGYEKKEIAAELGLSPRTVETHVLAIYRRLGVQTFASLLFRDE